MIFRKISFILYELDFLDSIKIYLVFYSNLLQLDPQDPLPG
jgi:hypothetical protein